MKVVEKGDHYVSEVAATVKAVMERWNQRVRSGRVPGMRRPSKHVLAWQSKVCLCVRAKTTDIMSNLLM